MGATIGSATTHALIWNNDTVQDITDTRSFPMARTPGRDPGNGGIEH